MSVFGIKVAAILLMVASHVGYFLLPQYPLLVTIGTAAFPLFAWLIANGARHTKDTRAYIIRLGIFALISQGPFILANHYILGTPWFYLNIFFTLFLGLFSIAILKHSNSRFLTVSVIIGALILADLLRTDYGAAGVLAIIIYHICYGRWLATVLVQALVLYGIPQAMLFIDQIATGAPLTLLPDYFIEPFGMALALLILFFHNENEGPKMRYFFYWFYPLHYLVILVLERVF